MDGEKQSVLFIGDSITDADRDREKDNLGYGYAFLTSAQLAYKYPKNKLNFKNRGVAGDHLEDMASRWKPDCLELTPDILSILIGVNDCHHYYTRQKRYVSDGEFSEMYSKLIENTYEKTKAKIILCEIFYLELGYDVSVFKKEIQPLVREEVERKNAIIKSLAERYGTYFVELYQPFLKSASYTCPENWSYDGVHPTIAGAQLIAKALLGVMERVL